MFGALVIAMLRKGAHSDNQSEASYLALLRDAVVHRKDLAEDPFLFSAAENETVYVLRVSGADPTRGPRVFCGPFKAVLVVDPGPVGSRGGRERNGADSRGAPAGRETNHGF